MRPEDSQILNQISAYWYPEGHLNFDQRDFFTNTLKILKPKSCLEIGFGSGRSAVTTLVTAQPEILVSVDQSLDYIPGARAHAAVLQQDFLNFKIVEGDSKALLNNKFFQSNFPHGMDFVFVDGNHGYAGCTSDLNSILPHLNRNGIVFVDDYRSGPPNGVTYKSVDQAVENFVLKNYLTLERWYRDGKGVAIVKRTNSKIQRTKTVLSILLRMLVRNGGSLQFLTRRKLRWFINGVFNGVNRRIAQVIVDKQSKRFINYNRKIWRGWSNKHSDSIIIVELWGVAETNIARSYFLNILARKHNAAIKSFARVVGNRSLHQVYKSFNTAGHIVPSLNGEQERRKKAISQEVMPGLKTKQDVFDLKVLGIWIGIDIYETYLRKGKPTVFLDDPKLFEIVVEGIGLVIFWQDYFAKNKVAAVVVSHDCYLHLDVLCKVSYQAQVAVYLPNIRGITYAERPHSVYPYFGNYREMFRRLTTEEQRNGIALAKTQLERRFSGEVGVDMPYATKSAFSSSSDGKKVLRKSEKIKVLICSHCFYDNPHGYGGMLFVDFYEWLCYLGKVSEKTDYDWYLKVHPDPWAGTLETIRGILAKFPRITLIPYETSHHLLVKEGIDFVLTAYGSVGHELPALGVQVINAGYNPHVAYDFNWHPKSLEEYEYYLLNLDKLHKEINLEELHEFYYMHYYYVLADDLILKSYRQSLMDLTTEQRIGSAVYGYFLDQLTDVKHQKIINNMQKFIDSGKPYYFSRGPE